MYLSKLLSVALLTTLTAAAATPSNLEAREQSGCRQAHAGLAQASQYYTSLSSQWHGSAKNTILQLIRELDSEANDVARTCAKLAEVEKSSKESFSGAEQAASDRFS
ncbi:hypothetical protein ANOM_003393 [Aspergillus nomiae NRRL 13137]|uniref:Cell wall protein n=1 Tax=Aspergillus nomiae NRRL (strain ATCC 15546 / NRRL 13137 / CBS 260.88 / M93) TaxID=1509407 RepID=A0A0L1J7X4_ASPN3|nr:uncharacterized protein ANOM_003393 [Aspergillus nomiae NRRL 13137]KNG87906.1 hypothetical protein ANOM_003393 [Aspergillus nomiae NRRL 13137]